MTSMTFDDHTANGQSQAHPVRLGRKKRVEYLVCFFGIDSRPRVLDFNDNRAISAIFGLHPQYSAIHIDQVHCVNRILHQIDHDFLQLTAMADYFRHLFFQLDAHGNVMFSQLAVESAQYAKRQVIQIDGVFWGIGCPKQLPNVVQYFTGAMTGSNDLFRS